MRFLLTALVLTVGAVGADLDEIRNTQQKLMGARDSEKLPRDEVPLALVALAKRQLLVWAESRLQAFGSGVEPGELTKMLSGELHTSIGPFPDDLDGLGDLDIAFSRPKGEARWLQLSTDVGIPCGADQSVYLYEWSEGRWNRRFALETKDDSLDRYGPQESVDVQISAAGPRGERLVLATGWPPACFSIWQTLYIKLFRVGPSQALLLEEEPLANQGEDYSTRLDPSEALIEFSGRSIDTDILVRKYVLHYAVDRDQVRRSDPIALSPQDFVAEWLTNPWEGIAAWSEPHLSEWHNRLHKDVVLGEYDAVQRCAKPGDWQVSIDFDDKTSYFSVTDLGDYRFRMSGISENPREDCSGRNELRRLEDPKPTLFPKN